MKYFELICPCNMRDGYRAQLKARLLSFPFLSFPSVIITFLLSALPLFYSDAFPSFLIFSSFLPHLYISFSLFHCTIYDYTSISASLFIYFRLSMFYVYPYPVPMGVTLLLSYSLTAPIEFTGLSRNVTLPSQPTERHYYLVNEKPTNALTIQCIGTQ
jgi:hypothetical protein